MAQNVTENNKRQFRSLEDILEYKEELRTRIHQDEESIASAWNQLFHKNEPEPQNKAHKLARILSLGTGVFDGVLLSFTANIRRVLSSSVRRNVDKKTYWNKTPIGFLFLYNINFDALPTTSLYPTFITSPS